MSKIFNKKLDYQTTIIATVRGASYPPLTEIKKTKEGKEYKSFVRDNI